MSIRTPTVLQHETTECGLAALAMLMGYHGCHVPLHELRAAAGVSRDGTSLRRLRDLARHYGFFAHAVSCEPDHLAERSLPLMAFVSFNHMVVVEDIGPRRVQVNDPASGPARLDRADFDRMFTGVALHVTPGPEVCRRPATPQRSAILRRAAVAVSPWAVAVLTCEAAAMVAASAFIGGTGPAALTAATLAVATPLAAAAGAAGRLARHLETHIGDAVLSTLLTRDPMFISQRSQPLLEALADSGTRLGRDTLAPLTVQAARLTASLLPVAALGLLHPLAGAATGAGMAGCAVLVAVTSGRRGSGHEGATVPEAPLGIPLRLPSLLFGGRDDDLLAALAGGRAEHSAPDARRVAATALQRGATVAIALAAAATAGAVAGPGGLALAGLALWPWLRVHQMPERLLDLRREAALIADTEASATARPTGFPTEPPGVLLLSDLCFGYGRAAPPLLDNLSLRLETGSQTGISGPVGAGKSTLAALAAGHLSPWAGSIRRGGTVLLVPEYPMMIRASLRDAVTLWDDSIPDVTIREALEAVRLWQELGDRPGGLDQAIEAHGQNLSGGQRRRLGIARALVRRPDILIIDEALDGVDLEAETLLRHHLRRRGITLLLISQRAESLAACDAVHHLPGCGAAPSQAAAKAASAAPPPPHDPDERAALERLLEALALPPLPPAEDVSGGGLVALRRGARRSGLLLRRVRLAGHGWCRNGMEPLLVRHAVFGWMPVVPMPGGGYRMILPDGTVRPLTDADADRLADDAVAVHDRPIPGVPLPKAAAAGVPARASTAPAIAALSVCMGVGLLASGPPLAVAALGVAMAGIGAAFGTLLGGRTGARRASGCEVLLTAHALRLPWAWLRSQGADRLAAWSQDAGSLAVGETRQAPSDEALAARATLASLLSSLAEVRGGGALHTVVAHWQHQRGIADHAARGHRLRGAISDTGLQTAIIAGLGLTAALPPVAPVLIALGYGVTAARSVLVRLQCQRRLGPFLAAPLDDAGSTPTTMDGTLSAENLTFRYRPDAPAVLEGASLHVAAGEVVAVVGASGAGKSTLIGILLGLLTPQAGTVRLGGHNMSDSDRTALRAACDALFQDEPLPMATLRSYLLGNTAYDADAAWTALAAVGLAEEVACWPMGLYTLIDQDRTVSGGQAQQLRLARALLRRPRLLILDEATAALDPSVQALVIGALRQRRITTLLTAHRAETLDLADRVLQLQDGRLRPLPWTSTGPRCPEASAPVLPALPPPPRIYRRAALDRYNGPEILDRITTLPTFDRT